MAVDNPSGTLAYLRLFRAPNVFTAMADVAMGYLISALSVRSWLELVLLITASSLMYTSGMVLNDVFDYDVDLRERPRRPLPAGQISRSWAERLGWGMLLGGVIVAWCVGLAAGTANIPRWRPGLIASLLAVCIVLYDGGAKRTVIGPLVMGSCRGFNVLLGMSLHAQPLVGTATWSGWSLPYLLIALGITAYITGVTVFARSEATASPRHLLTLGVVIMACGIVTLAAFPRFFLHQFSYFLEPRTNWPLAMFLISFWIFRPCFAAILRPDPRRVQMAVKTCLLSLIILDATLCALFCPSTYAIGIVLLLIPALVLGRWVYST